MNGAIHVVMDIVFGRYSLGLSSNVKSGGMCVNVSVSVSVVKCGWWMRFSVINSGMQTNRWYVLIGRFQLRGGQGNSSTVRVMCNANVM